MSAYATDFDAMGLSNHSPFAILSAPRKPPGQYKTPKKRGPKPSRKDQAITALMTPAERATARILRDNSKQFHVGAETQADRDKTARLIGKRNSARSQ